MAVKFARHFTPPVAPAPSKPPAERGDLFFATKSAIAAVADDLARDAPPAPFVECNGVEIFLLGTEFVNSMDVDGMEDIGVTQPGFVGELTQIDRGCAAGKVFAAIKPGDAVGRRGNMFVAGRFGGPVGFDAGALGRC